MDFQKIILIAAITIVGVITLQKWNQDYYQYTPEANQPTPYQANLKINQQNIGDGNIGDEDVPQLSPTNKLITDVKQKVLENNHYINVKTDVFDIQINPDGGDIIGLSLLKYPENFSDNDRNKIPFRLFVQKENCQTEQQVCEYVAQSALMQTDGPSKNNRRLKYQFDKHAYQLQEDTQTQLVVELYANVKNINIIKKYTFNKSSYQIQLAYIIENKSNKIWEDRLYAQLKRDLSDDPSTVHSSSPTHTYLGAASRTTEKNFVKLPFKDFKKDHFEQYVKGGYAAILQQYFISAWVPDQTNKHLFYTNQSVKTDRYFIGYLEDISLEPGQTKVIHSTLYAGPKNQEVFEKIADGLQLTMDYGWLWFLSQPLFMLMKFIHSLVGNWGWSIILLTVFVKLLFYPLNATSFRSMAKMRKITPKLQALKEKYGDDRQKLSQEMMNFYKKEKVNPMGGCLPILVQMPVFIALYWVLVESVELRHAPWMFWINDLTHMDPYFILPIIMGVSMFVQQMLNPSPPDPIQAKVMKYMPIAFTFFFLWFPSGLVLYWITNNTISIIQQYIISKNLEKTSNKGINKI